MKFQKQAKDRLRPSFREPHKTILRLAYRKPLYLGFSVEAISNKSKIKSSCAFQVQHWGRLKPLGKRVDSSPEICDKNKTKHITKSERDDVSYFIPCEGEIGSSTGWEFH